MLLLHVLSESGHCAVEGGTDGCGRKPQSLGDMLLGQVLVDAQYDDEALLVRELQKSLEKQVALLDISGKVWWSGSERSFAVEESGFQLPPTSSTGSKIDHYTLEVGTEIVRLSAKAETTDDSSESVLDQILGLLAIADKKESKPNGVGCMCLIEARQAVSP